MSTSKRALRKSLRTNFAPGPRDYLNRVVLRSRQAAHLPAYLFHGEMDRPIFVIGAPRSGTSMLYAILRASKALAHWPGEAHEVWEADHHPALRGWDSNVLDASDADPATAARIKRSFFLVTGPQRRLIDKTPRNSFRVPFIDRIFPDARYVYLKRDGRDNASSLINAWRTPRYRTYRLAEPHSIRGVDPHWWKFVLYPGWREDRSGPLELVCAKQWKSSNEAALDAATGIGPDRWLEIRYEDLTEDAVAQVRTVLDFADVAWDAAVEEHAEAARSKPVNVVTPPERGKWRRENPQEIAAILELIRPTMQRMGYVIDEK